MNRTIHFLSTSRTALVLLLATLLTATAAQTAWADSAFSGGSGTEAAPYQIKTTADLQQLATDVNGGNSYSSKYFKVMNDINFTKSTENNMTAIGGQNSRTFNGVFDGNGKTISGINIRQNSLQQALFGRTSNATIQNVILDDCTITGSGNNVAGIVGWANAGTVSNCIVKNTTISQYYDVTISQMGAIVAYIANNSTTLTNNYYINCTVAGSTSNVGYWKADVSGARQAFATSQTALCHKVTLNNTDLYVVGSSAVSVTSYDYTGSAIAVTPTVTYEGATLDAANYTVSITNSNSVDVTGNVVDLGVYTLTVSGANSKGYYGSLSTTFSVVSGLSGSGTSDSPYLISTVTDWNTFATKVNSGLDADKYYQLSDTWNNTSDAVTTTVGTSSHPFQGHFLGNGKTLNVNITDGGEAAALFRYISGATIKNMTVSGSVGGGIHCAALVGYAADNTTNLIEGITVSAAVTTSGTHCGGIMGHGKKSATTIKDCIFSGSISGGTHVGVLWGWSDSGCTPTIQNCFEKGSSYTGANVNPIGLISTWGTVTDAYYMNATKGSPNQSTTRGSLVFTTPQSGFCKRVTLDGSDYYATGTVAITTPTHYDYNGGAAISVTPAMTYDGAALSADCFTAIITKDGNAVSTVADKGRYTLSILGDNSKGYYGAKNIYFYVMADLSGSGTQESPYLISDAADWEKFAANISSGTNTSGYYQLTADITGVESMAGTSTNRFCGTFDGNGKTLTLSLTTDGSEYTAPFRYVGSGATITRLTTAGYVSAGNQKYATGLIGSSEGTVSITACRSSVAISSDRSSESNKDATHGGFIGVQGNGAVTFTNCLFDGSITDAAATNCGGFVGWRSNGTLTFDYCLMAGTMTLSTTDGSATFNRNGSSTATTSYYRTAYGDVQGNAVGTMNNADLATALGSGWEVIGSDVLPIMGDKDLATATISGVSATYNYSGTPIEITYTVTAFGGATLTKGTHYTATIDGTDATTVSTAGLHTLTITAKDGSGYTGSQSVSFRVFVPLAYQQYDTTNKELTDQTISAGTYSLMTSSTTGMDTGWYVVTEDVTASSRIWVNGDVSLVLCDGVTLTASRGIEVRSGKSLTIYTQSGNTGALTANSVDQYGSAIGGAGAFASGGTITIHGGEISATSYGEGSCAIGGNSSTVTIYGGRVSAWHDLNSTSIGGADATVNLGWCRSTDNIYAKSFGGTVNLLGNFVFDDNRQQVVTTDNVNSNRRIVPQGNEWFVLFNSQGGSAVAQQTIDNNATATEPTAPTRTGYTFGGWYTDADCTDGNAYDFSAAVTANLTLYAKWTLTPFAITTPESFEATVGGSAATTATMGQTVTLTLKSGYTLRGSITATDANSQTVALTDEGNGTYTFTMPASAVNVVAFAGIIEPGWTLAGTYKTQNFTADDTYYYGFVGTAGTGTELGTFVQVGGYVRVKPMRAYLVAPGGTPKAAARRMTRAADGEELPATLRVRLLGSNGETTGIVESEKVIVNSEKFASATGWYTLDGRRLAGKPSQRGIYINKGKKVVIK